MVRTWGLHCGGLGSSPGWGTPSHAKIKNKKSKVVKTLSVRGRLILCAFLVRSWYPVSGEM